MTEVKSQYQIGNTLYVEIELPSKRPQDKKITISSREVLNFLIQQGKEIVDFVPAYVTNSNEVSRKTTFVFYLKPPIVQEPPAPIVETETQSKKRGRPRHD